MVGGVWGGGGGVLGGGGKSSFYGWLKPNCLFLCEVFCSCCFLFLYTLLLFQLTQYLHESGKVRVCVVRGVVGYEGWGGGVEGC